MAGAVAIASPVPVRNPEGATTDWPFQPLADCGNGNPFFYHSFGDDFDPYRATDYTVTTSGTGATVAATSGDGGLLLFTAGTTAGNASIQHPSGNQSFTLNSTPKKVFFESRQQLANVSDAGISVIAGLIQSTATPGTVTDGVYLKFVNGTMTINSVVGSVTTSATIPTAAFNITPNTNWDWAFYITRTGDILAYVDTQLVGYMQQSQINTPNNPQNAGAVARITAPTLTAVVLTPTIGIVQTGTNAGRTMTVDFFQAQKER
jgi:hypothetical protein